MPLYDFFCRACGQEFEALVMGGGQPACPHCGSNDLQKRMSSFSTRTGSMRTGGRGPAENTGAGSKCSGCGGGNCGTCH